MRDRTVEPNWSAPLLILFFVEFDLVRGKCRRVSSALIKSEIHVLLRPKVFSRDLSYLIDCQGPGRQGERNGGPATFWRHSGLVFRSTLEHDPHTLGTVLSSAAILALIETRVSHGELVQTGATASRLRSLLCPMTRCDDCVLSARPTTHGWS